MKKIGVLALQGGVREHVRMVEKCSAKAIEVRTRNDLDSADALVLPGGESTTILKLLKRICLDRDIIRRAGEGMPVYGTCAGAIILAKHVGGNTKTGLKGLGLIDVCVERNFFGRQADSFEEKVQIQGLGGFRAVFIRAPVIRKTGNNVDVLSRLRAVSYTHLTLPTKRIV